MQNQIKIVEKTLVWVTIYFFKNNEFKACFLEVYGFRNAAGQLGLSHHKDSISEVFSTVDKLLFLKEFFCFAFIYLKILPFYVFSLWAAFVFNYSSHLMHSHFDLFCFSSLSSACFLVLLMCVRIFEISSFFATCNQKL